MKYNVGDRVRIKSFDWYNKNKNQFERVNCGGKSYTLEMCFFCGKILTIQAIGLDFYLMEEDKLGYEFTDEMIEGLVEEEEIEFTEEDKYWCDIMSESDPTTYVLPQGYQFKDENGNIINATKIVLEKKKKEYPKTYEECCRVLGIDVRDLDILDNMLDTSEIIYRKNLDRLLNSFRKLLICRDAYWEIAGEEMGLGKPWEPDYDGTFEDGTPIKYVIHNNGTRIVKERKSSPNHILAFPTEEMRDAFYENFKGLIEQCKELL